MNNWMHQRILYVCLGCLFMMTPVALSQNLIVEEEIELEIIQVAKIRMKVFEDTKRARNHRFNKLFRDYTQKLGGEVTSGAVKRFNVMLGKHGMTSFDDFMEVEMRPLRYVKDPVTGEQLPVYGALGSDLINPWLAAAGVVDGNVTFYVSVYGVWREAAEKPTAIADA